MKVIIELDDQDLQSLGVLLKMEDEELRDKLREIAEVLSVYGKPSPVMQAVGRYAPGSRPVDVADIAQFFKGHEEEEQ